VPKRSLGRATKESLRIGRLLYPEAVHRPRSRVECPDSRPCGYIGCRQNLWCDITDLGRIAVRPGGLEPWDVDESCALDLAERGGMTLEEVARVLSMTRERVRQIEQAALAKVGTAALRSLL
jgi:hypothetical protein